MANKNNLTNILFETLHDLRGASEENLQLKVNKAHAVIAVAKEVLEVGKLRVEIAKLGGTGVDFPEISEDEKKMVAIPVKQVNNGNGGKT